MDWEERVDQLFFEIKMCDLPPLAYDYAKHLCQKYGMCGEVMVTAYAHYVELVEGLVKQLIMDKLPKSARIH